MPKNSAHYAIYTKDEDGQFTKLYTDRHGGHVKLALSDDDVIRLNSRELAWEYRDWRLDQIIQLPSSNYQWCRYRNADWRERELARFNDGTYTPIPFDDIEPIPDHFAHVSLTDQALISFTQSPQKGELDIQTPMKPGRYFTKFYPHLGPDQIRAMATSIDKALEVRFAKSADEIVAVYTNGPNSCMSHDLSHYSLSVHPVSVYGNSDLQLAYLAPSEKGRASARALVWPEKLIHGRIYGDEGRLKPALQNLGYKEGVFEGAKISKILDDGCYVIPYLDWLDTFGDVGTHLVITRNGDYCASGTNGLCTTEDEDEEEDSNTQYCPRMQHFYDPDETTFYYIVDRSEDWSQDTVDFGYAYRCDESHDYYSSATPAYEMTNGETWAEPSFLRHGLTCPRTGHHVPKSEAIFLHDIEAFVDPDWADEHAYRDPATGLSYAEQREAA